MTEQDHSTADETVENKVAVALDLETSDDVRKELEGLHPADFSDQFEQLSNEQRADLVKRAGDLSTGEVLTELEDEVVEDILPLLPAEQIAEALTELDNDDATQIFEEMDDGQREEILDVLEPEDGITAIGSGGNYALSAARALVDYEKDAEVVAEKAMKIAGDICVYTNHNFKKEVL